MEFILERFSLVKERIGEIKNNQESEEKYRDYFCQLASLLDYVNEVYDDKEKTNGLDKCKERNEKLFASITTEEGYKNSYLNPSYAEEKLGEEFGKILSFLMATMRSTISLAFEEKLEDLLYYEELFVQVYTAFCDEYPPVEKDIKEIIYWFYHDYSEIFVEENVREMVDYNYDFYTKIIMESDLTDLTYLYKYGLYISETEVKTAEFINSLPEEKVKLMADTYTEGYRIGFEVTGKDLTKKETVEVRYPIGFERMVKVAIKNFEKLGLKPVILKRSVFSTPVNRQYSYDHKNDQAVYLDKGYVERRLEVLKNSFEKYKDKAAKYAGPAVIETFGEKPFEPKTNKSAISFSEEQQKLNVYNASKSGQITNTYIKGEERSFTIIAFPVPDIGEKFEEIFDETIKLNTLDYMLYRDMQQKIIDCLDESERVHIKGKGDNETDLFVELVKTENKDKETKFENCVADVNIPVGEVFTSPVLKGTTGVLHVSEVYLNGLRYDNLKVTFEDGMVKDYTCKNFETEEESKKYIKENVLMHHETLPMGEFAIGTNTTAYRMAKDFGIASLLPILIAEKTGPHFAVGDTCYSHAEDTKVYNPDGKEIIARDNEVSILRNEDPQKAYFNCHTDITIPFEELLYIRGIRKDESFISIIEDGRFVVEGTEKLNEPLEGM